MPSTDSPAPDIPISEGPDTGSPGTRVRTDGSHDSWYRRRYLQMTGSVLGATTLSGCLFGLDGGHPPGTLVVRNDHEERHTVRVTVTKTSEDDEIGNDDEPPTSTPIWKRETELTVDAGKKATKQDLITETGAFFVEVRVPNVGTDSTWSSFYEAANGGIAEDSIFVTIQDHGAVTVFPSHGD
jgi:hypothetical protein